MNRVFLDPFLQRLAWTLVHFLWQGAALGLTAWLVLMLLRRCRPQIRYGASCLFLALCVVIPVTTFLGMGEAPRLGAEALETTTFKTALLLRGRLQPVLPVILVAWSIGVGLFALRALAAYVWLQRIRSRGQQLLEQRWQACVDAMRKRRRIRRAVPLLESDRVRSPLTTGLLRPVILVPLGFFTSLDPLAAEAVLAHELAHIRRLDVLVIGLQTGIETLLFYHPAVWWISRRVANEREHCCDDDAVKACGDAVLFAHVLQRLDALREAPLTLAPQLQAGAGGGDLMERIKRLLAIEPGPVRLAAPGLSALVAITLCATTLAAQQEPVQQAVHQLVALGSRALSASSQGAAQLAAATDQFAPQESDARTSTNPPAQELVLPSPRSAATLGPDEGLLQVPGRDDESATETGEAPPASSHLDPTRLGYAFSSIPHTSARIDPWPEGTDRLEAAALPAYDADLAALRGGPAESDGARRGVDPQGAESTRLLRLTIPAASALTVCARGTSGGARDSAFDVDFLELKSLMAWGCWVGLPKQAYPNALSAKKDAQGTATLFNAGTSPQPVVVVINGPKRTPYRVDKAVHAMKASVEAGKPGYPVEPWPADSIVDLASAPETSAQFQPGLVALFPGDGRLPSDHRRTTIDRDIPILPTLDWHPTAPGFPTGLILYRPVTHLRCLALDVQPGERLAFKARLGSQVRMEVVTPRGDEDARWLQAVEMANSPASHLQLANPTDKPQKLVLVLYRLKGMTQGYTVELTRTAGHAQ